MEEMMMYNKSPEIIPRNETTFTESITNTSTSTTWKLYENPFYNSDHNLLQQNQQPNLSQFQSSNIKNLQNCLHLPLSASFWDLIFFKPVVMESELDLARAQIIELTTELVYERKARKKLESMNRRVIKELEVERNGREAVERVCQELTKDISSYKAEISRIKREIEEERKMMRISEVLREERVRMKLTEAKFFLQEKIWELESCKLQSAENSPSNSKHNKSDEIVKTNSRTNSVTSSGKFRDLMLAEKLGYIHNSGVDLEEATKPILDCKSNYSSTVINQRKASPEAENPHIKRGIKGFVEFPKVIRAIGSKNNRNWGSITKLECQKSQLRILLKQKKPNPIDLGP